jgi:hypothetical protein
LVINGIYKEKVMYKKKLTPEESLQAIKMRMNYDLKKTLNENGGIIIEQGSPCPNSISYSELRRIGEEAGSIVKKMDASFVRMGYGEERANELYDIVKGLVGKNVYDDISGECINAIDQFKKSFKQTGSRGWFQGGFDIESKLNEFKKGYYSDEPEVIRFINAILSVLSKKTNVQPAPKSAPETNKKENNAGTKKSVGIKPPSELATVEGIKVFQDWLDKNHPGWASGYKDGIINKGKNGGGYGTFGPRTSKAWSSYKSEYLSGKTVATNTNKQDDEEVSISGEGGVNEPMD